MINDEIINIKQDKPLYEYLKYHSYWYKEIKRDGKKLNDMIKEMKIELKQTTSDKIIDLNKKIEFLSSLMELLS